MGTIIFLIIAAIFVVMMIITFLSWYRKCPSDKILVIFGKVRGQQASLCIHGGAKMVIPVIQDYGYISLRPMQINVNLDNALCKQNIRISVPSVFTVGVSTDPALMGNAADRLLGLAPDAIADLAKDIIFGQLRLVIASMMIEEINADRESFLRSVEANVAEELKKLGLHTAILTGDTETGARRVANELEIPEVYAGLLPQQKLEVLQQIRGKHGAVMFVGDGINDAPVLAGADVGVAMGSGADAALEAADAVFMTSKVSSIPEAVAIARQTYRVAVQNVVVALAIKLAVMVLGLVGFANMWLAVFADSGVALLCVLNSIRILYGRRKQYDREK